MISQASDITCLKSYDINEKISVLFHESHCKKVSARCRARKHFNLYSNCFVDQENILIVCILIRFIFAHLRHP